jgi:hypothetical protein
MKPENHKYEMPRVRETADGRFTSMNNDELGGTIQEHRIAIALDKLHEARKAESRNTDIPLFEGVVVDLSSKAAEKTARDQSGSDVDLGKAA